MEDKASTIQDNIMLRVDCGMSVWVYQNPQFRTAPGEKQEENT